MMDNEALHAHIVFCFDEAITHYRRAQMLAKNSRCPILRASGRLRLFLVLQVEYPDRKIVFLFFL